MRCKLHLVGNCASPPVMDIIPDRKYSYPLTGVKFVSLSSSRKLHYGSIDLETGSSSRRPILIWLIVSQSLALASLFFWLVAAGLSVMAFDAGVTQAAWNFVIAVWAFPIWPIAFTGASSVAYARKKDRLAGILITLTFLPILVLIIFIVLSNFFFSLGW